VIYRLVDSESDEPLLVTVDENAARNEGYRRIIDDQVQPKRLRVEQDNDGAGWGTTWTFGGLS
jgi:hypothetical protein